MSNVRISQLPVAPDPISGSELVPVVQNGQTVQTTVNDLVNSPTQTQTFITINNEPTLPNSRYIGAGLGLSASDGGPQGSYVLSLTGTAASLENALTGIIAKTGTGTITPRTIIAYGGLSIADGNGVSGNPTITTTGLLSALASTTGTGLMATAGGTTITPVAIQGTVNEIDVANGNTQPIIGLADNPVIPGTGSVAVPKGTTGQRPLGTNGQVRFNTSTNRFEGYQNGWTTFGTGDGTVTFVNASGGTTGMSFTGGPITSSGTLTLTGTPTKATNVAGGNANEVVYQTGADTTGFISAPTVTDTFLKWNGATFAWSALPGAGTVTSVGLAMPTEFTVTNSPVTSAGTLTAAWNSQTANYFFAAPNGAPGVPTFRAMVAADVPTLNQNTTGSAASLSISGQTGLLTFTGLTSTNRVKTVRDADDTILELAGSYTPTGSWNWTTATVTWPTFNQNTTGQAGSVANAITFTNTGGLSPGATFDGSATKTIDYSTVGAPKADGTGATGTWAIDISGNAATATTAGSSTTATTATNIAGGAAGSIAYQTGAGTTAMLAASSGVLVGGTTPSYSTAPSLSGTNFSSIPNSALQNSSITIGTTGISLGGTASTLAGLTSVTVTQNPSAALDLATKQYVDGLVATGITYHTPVKYEVPIISLNATYNNGTGGVGATLTNAGTKAAFAPDGPTASVGDRILVYNQTNAYENGVYEVTVVGTPDPGGTNWVLTRTADADSYGLKNPNALGEGDAFFVSSGNTGAGETYVCNTSGTINFGTTPITFVQVSDTQIYSAGTGLTLTGTQFSLTVPVVAANGGTGLTSYTTGDILYYATGTALSKLAIGSSSYIMTSTGSAPQWSSPSGITIGTASNIAGGAAGSVPYNTALGTTTFLGIGTSTYLMTSSGSAPQWSDPAGVTVGNATNAGTATNANNIAITAVSTNASFYPVFVNATTGNLAPDVDSDLTYNPSTNTLTAATFSGALSGNATTATTATNIAGGSGGSLPYQSSAGSTTFLGIGTNGYVLTSSGTAPQWTSGSSISVGTATNLAGGTAGAIAYQTGAGTTSFLSLGTTDYVLVAGISAPQYAAQSTLSVGSATTATNANNIAITAVSTNASFYPVFVNATTGNLAADVDADLTYNPSTNTLTGGTGVFTTGISGGTF